MQSWIVERRRKVCISCARKKECQAERVLHTLFAERTACPLGLHLSRLDAIEERAHPANVDRLSGCCDAADQA